jgi:hypothetical protein
VASDGLIELLGEILSEELKEMGSEAQNRIVTEKSSNLSEWVTEEVVDCENWKSMLVP